ncbi:MAG: tyrosine-type recombinase/integrase [Clostridia bacterium]|nr:tyrosine-type recombinase/integrase [Clostridia bacterium]
MNTRIITPHLIDTFAAHLRDDEKSASTEEKYLRDLRRFAEFLQGRTVDKHLVLEYKTVLAQRGAVTAANSVLASLNSFLRFAGWCDCTVKQFRVQKKAYCPEEKELTREEYVRLVRAAERNENERLSLVLQSICGTGIRVSELQYITVEAAQKGEATVSCKGKTRTVFIVSSLRKKLLRYAKAQGITCGAIFVTRGGKPLNRSNIWRQMKSLCESASVSPEKVFPHNLRHLFARIFYGIEKDIAKLADILGHSNVNTTRIYIITTGAEHKRKMENMRLIL